MPYELGEPLDPQERDRREKLVAEMLGLTDVRLILRQLARDRNVWLVLDNKLVWGSF